MRISIINRGSDHFLKPLLKHWSDRGWDFIKDVAFSYDPERKLDVVWVEWANELSIVALSGTKRKNVIVRMLGSEYWQYFWKKWDTSKLFCVVQSSGVTVIPDVDWYCIPPAIDIDFWLPADETPGRSNRLLVVGNYIYTKNHIGLLRILSERPKEFDVVTFVGNIPKEPGRNPMGYIEAHKIIDLSRRYAERYGINLEIQGKMEPRDLRSLYYDTRYMVCPAINSFSAVIGEALACGTRTIVADWPGSWCHWPESIIYTTSKQFWKIVDDYPIDSSGRREWVKGHMSPEVIYPKIDNLIEKASKV